MQRNYLILFARWIDNVQNWGQKFSEQHQGRNSKVVHRLFGVKSIFDESVVRLQLAVRLLLQEYPGVEIF